MAKNSKVKPKSSKASKGKTVYKPKVSITAHLKYDKRK
jgi:hypothetical protein